MSSLSEYIKHNVPAKDYWEWVFPPEDRDNPAKWPLGGGECKVYSPLRERERTPSLSINPDTGAWYDFGAESDHQGDRVCGSSIVSFHSALSNLTNLQSATEIFHQFIHPVISPKKIRQWHRSLESDRRVLSFITKHRGLAPRMVEELKLGWDGQRITFPIENEFGLYVNVRRYDPGASKKKRSYKVINYKDESDGRSFGSPSELFPYRAMARAFECGYIFIVEGEWDASILNQMGIPSVTSTNGVKSWPNQYTEKFNGLKVYVCVDNDDTSQKVQKQIVKRLRHVAKAIHLIKVPKKHGKDVNDWYLSSPIMRKSMGWEAVMKRSKEVVSNTERRGPIKKGFTPLDLARHRDNIGKHVKVRAVVAGKSTDPISVPLKYRITCEHPDRDELCPLYDSDRDYIDGEVKIDSEMMFDLLTKKKSMVRSLLLKRHGFDPQSDAMPNVETIEYANFEELRIQPSIEDSGCKEHVTVSSYCYGLGLQSNQTYIFEGTSYPTEVGNLTKMLLTKNEPAVTQAEQFRMTPDKLRSLEAFQPRKSGVMAIMRKLYQIAEWQSRNITKIRERPDLHIGVDLVYHSVSEFDFNGEHIRRGMLDVVVMGDTRCGKGQVTEGLKHYYGMGEIVSGENCTFAGLAGGVQQMGKQWFITWGSFALNHNRLVVVDEASALHADDGFAKLSRIRSEGVAEITKIVRETTMAKTRLLWLANPVSGRPIMSYPSGAHAIKELVGANEDISRFDFALTVATNEVDSGIINDVQAGTTSKDQGRFPRASCRDLVLWAWSRERSQIRFTTTATKETIDQAITFGNTYSSSIPLVQSENIRIKIAKIATSIAARVFSNEDNGQIILVDKEHVQAACRFLRMVYSKPSMAYDIYSQNDSEDTAMNEVTQVAKIINTFQERSDGDELRDQLIRFLNRHARFSVDALADYIGMDEAKQIVKDLVQARCINRSATNNHYIRTPEFTQYIRELRGTL